jgi:pimeloyl-ACP methyl ester carboxylesterase
VADFEVQRDGALVAGEEAGEGTPVVGLHGLTATRRYVIMGSRSLERSGHRVVLYDARGHGRSGPAPDSESYTYEDLAGDLLAVLDDRGIERAVLAGASMGAHTILRFALDHPERVAGLVVVTPAFEPGAERDYERWDALAEGLRSGGVEGFVEAYGDPPVPDAYKETVFRILRQRLSAHEHPEAVADALQAVPRAAPLGSWEELERIDAPTVVVASRDDADPEHPYEVGERYAEAIPGAELRSEEPGQSPLAWQGGQLSKVIAELAARALVLALAVCALAGGSARAAGPTIEVVPATGGPTTVLRNDPRSDNGGPGLRCPRDGCDPVLGARGGEQLVRPGDTRI